MPILPIHFINLIYNDRKLKIFCLKIAINLRFITIMYLKTIFNKFICYNDLLKKIGIINDFSFFMKFLIIFIKMCVYIINIFYY